MKNIFFFILGILFMASISVYQVPKSRVCPTTLRLQIFKSGKLVTTKLDYGDVISVFGDGEKNYHVQGKNYLGDSIRANIIYK